MKSYKIKNLINLEKITALFLIYKRKMINKNIKKILNKSEIDSLSKILD